MSDDRYARRATRLLCLAGVWLSLAGVSGEARAEAPAAEATWYQPTKEDSFLPMNRRDPFGSSAGNPFGGTTGVFASVNTGLHTFFGAGVLTGKTGSEVTGRIGNAFYGVHAGVYLPSNLAIIGLDFFNGVAWKVADFRSPDIQLGILGPSAKMRVVFDSSNGLGNVLLHAVGVRAIFLDLITLDVRVPSLGIWFRVPQGAADSPAIAGSWGMNFDVGLVF